MTSQATTHEDAGRVLAPKESQRIIRDFTLLYHELRDQTLGRTRWMGVSVVKTPMDLVVLQEIVAETRPELLIETGVYAGGSTLYLAMLMDALELDGKVVGIDIDLSGVSPHIGRHPRVELWEGSSTDPALVERLKAEAEGRRTMVDLDADHRMEHVLAELEALAPLVTAGCYLVVEDTWLGARPVRPDEAPGPAGALEEWMSRGQPFEVDRWRERLLLTSSPGGYLRRLDPTGAVPGGPPRLDRFLTPAGAPGQSESEHAPDPEQLDRYAHEAEYASLRSYAERLEQRVEWQRQRLHERDRHIAELVSGSAGPPGLLRSRARRALGRLARPGTRGSETVPAPVSAPGESGRARAARDSSPEAPAQGAGEHKDA